MTTVASADSSHSPCAVEQVRNILTQQAPLHNASAEAVAARLGWSLRKLQRRLRESGTSFRKIREELLEERACQLLLQSGLSVSDVAVVLCYRETNSFRRAFKSWTGRTPSAASGVSPAAPVPSPEHSNRQAEDNP